MCSIMILFEKLQSLMKLEGCMRLIGGCNFINFGGRMTASLCFQNGKKDQNTLPNTRIHLLFTDALLSLSAANATGSSDLQSSLDLK